MITYIEQDREEVIIHSDQKLKRIKRAMMSCIKALCLEYGSSYEGRKTSVKRVCHIKQKVPVMISERTKDMLFPTADIRSLDCCWINYQAIISAKGNHQQSHVKFKDGSQAVFSCDVRCIKREMKICKTYLDHLERQYGNTV